MPSPSPTDDDAAGPAAVHQPLAREVSPYLLQHAHNPVDWHAWGPDAWERARTEDKPVLVSIGYAACHWCHVMEHESSRIQTSPSARTNFSSTSKWTAKSVPTSTRSTWRRCSCSAARAAGRSTSSASPTAGPSTRTYFPPVGRTGLPAWPEVLRPSRRPTAIGARRSRTRPINSSPTWGAPTARRRTPNFRRQLPSCGGRPRPS